MRRFVVVSLVCVVFIGCTREPEDTFGAVYALTAGHIDSAPRLEDFSPDSIENWLRSNRGFEDRLAALATPANLDELIDRRLLDSQIEHELYRWGEFEAHRNDPRAYSDLANHCLTPILVRSNLNEDARIAAVTTRLDALRRLMGAAQSSLARGGLTETASAIRDLRSTAGFFRSGLVAALGVDGDRAADVERSGSVAAESLEALAAWLESSLEGDATDAWGEPRYGRELALAYGDTISVDLLEQLAADEIETVRGLMVELARREHTRRETDPMPTDFADLVDPLLAEMERTNAGSQQAFLDEFLELIDRSERFLRERDLVDLPAQRTLYTALSPAHFAGAAVGGVSSAGPFDPEAETLFYLPTIPDDAPDEAKDGFYRSFNTAFNTMIITHEIYPGHYLQLKAAAGHPSRVRPLFAGNDFTEGWATFCEQMTLDAGWDDDRPTTRLAHLRKRLENAVRAYVSVQVHCREWDRDRLSAFAVETGLLPPQFAENLWHRAVLTPIQLPSYFVGYRVFDVEWKRQQKRLGVEFSPKAFNNAVLESGGIPMDLLDEYLDERLQ
jgi:hypothetical protein